MGIEKKVLFVGCMESLCPMDPFIEKTEHVLGIKINYDPSTTYQESINKARKNRYDAVILMGLWSGYYPPREPARELQEKFLQHPKIDSRNFSSLEQLDYFKKRNVPVVIVTLGEDYNSLNQFLMTLGADDVIDGNSTNYHPMDKFVSAMKRVLLTPKSK